MELEECRSEESIGLQESVTTAEDVQNGSAQDKTPKNISSPSGKRKRKTNSPPSSPNTYEGFGDSEAGDILKQFPELEEVFTIISKVGEGTFSNVYLAKMKAFPDHLCALKHIIPTSGPARIENELKCLQRIGGKDNVIGIETAYRRNDHIVFVLPYVDHRKFQEYFLDMSMCHIRQYMKNLFTALRRVHSFDVIHRDIKPSNFLYSFRTKQYSLVDFGLAMPVPGSNSSLLASTEKKPTTPKNSSKNPVRRSTRLSPQVENKDEPHEASTKKRSPSSKTKSVLKPSENIPFTHNSRNFKMPVSKRQSKVHELKQAAKAKLFCPNKHSAEEICTGCMSRSHQNAPRAGTPGFRSPEVLLKYPNQTTAVDIWSGGIMMLCLLSGRYPFFRAYDDLTALAQIISISGSSDCIKTADNLGKDIVANTNLSQGDLKAACQQLRRGSSKTPTVQCVVQETKNPDMSKHCKVKKQRQKSPSSKHPSHSDDSKDAQSNICYLCKEQNPVECVSRPRESVTKHLDGSPCHSQASSCCWSAPSSAYDLLKRCLDLNPNTRITASQALEHPFFKE